MTREYTHFSTLDITWQILLTMLSLKNREIRHYTTIKTREKEPFASKKCVKTYYMVRRSEQQSYLQQSSLAQTLRTFLLVPKPLAYTC